MKRFSLLVVMAAVLVSTTAAAGWIRTYGGEEADGGYCVQQTSDGGYIITGSTRSFGSGNNDLWLLKTDAEGDTLWTRIYGGEEPDVGRVVRQTADGGYMVIGLSGSFGAESYTPWVLKADVNGDTLWTRTYGGYRLGNIWIEQTSEGDYIIAGRGLWLLKIDSLGEVLWERTYESEGCKWGSCVKQTSDGGYIITGATSEFDLFLVKTDSLGDILWESTCGGEGLDRGIYVEEMDDGGYIIAGARETEPWHIRIWLLETNAFGDIIRTHHWEEMFPAELKPLALTNDGGCVLAGETSGGVTLIKTDADWNTSWTRTYEVGDEVWTKWVECTSDGGYIITGDNRYSGTENYDLWLIKTDSLGYVEGVVEDRVVEAPNWGVITSIGPQIVLRYADHAEGFHAAVFDATGCKVEKLHDSGSSGTITWGKGHSPGVYFIRLESDNPQAPQKVILIR